MNRPQDNDERQRPPLMIFEHIPKTAGSTMHGILWQLYRPGQVFMSCNPGEYHTQIDSLSKLLADDGCPIRVFISHAGYGAHDAFLHLRSCRHFTLLRDPVERTISHFYYAKKKREVSRSLSFEQYLTDDPIRRCNAQANFLSGEKSRLELDGTFTLQDYQPPPDLFDRSASVLKNRIDAFGFTERFDEAMVLLRHEFDWPLIPSLYVRRNVNPDRKSASELSESDRKLLYAANEVDMALYRFAERIFRERIENLGFDMDSRLASYRRMNRAYSAVRPLLYPVARPMVHLGRRVGLL